MTTFTASTTAEAVVPVARERVWEVLIDPDLVARFTPFVSSIEEKDGDWIWTLSGLKVAGKGFGATFTEKMTLDEGRRIEFTHDPPSDSHERAGVHGWYDLSDHGVSGDSVLLKTSLEICVDLPLPKLSGGAVRSTMKGVMAQMGDRFSKNLLNHLGVS
ncbi:SRPBCC family protein [Nocardioides sp.]|uniref:SRPBCC family protein n=1 Tax=Nocardioides sp. TaxID=35761 RepID=UPI002B2657AF|nr:SRPBCC family protein [Nocardioides sp.]